MPEHETVVEHRAAARPFFSVCIPQYNRTSFLLYALARLQEQTYRAFEVCISDDCSTDGRAQEILDYLNRSGMAFVYEAQAHNVRYDANLRSAIGLARGQYALLMGNDDCLAAPDTLEQLQRAIGAEYSTPAVVLTNYREFETGRVMRRVRRVGAMGGGVDMAVRAFRNFSFVSGLLLDTRLAQQAATAKCDGSEMYQMYIACRLIAQGGTLFNLDQVSVCQGVRLPNENVDSYARRPRLDPCPIVERHLPLNDLGRVVFAAVQSYVALNMRGRVIRSIFAQILAITYPFWLFEYRRVQSWNYAVGVALGMRPRNLFQGLRVDWVNRTWLSLLYGLVSAAGLILPIRAFEALYPRLYALAKR
ncbi:MAG TPA: glycosyltransferase family 2 protein [Anaerolineae bacterium]|nr:glycosyltransferase family 2 protein [Anaerolineae bacterium]